MAAPWLADARDPDNPLYYGRSAPRVPDLATAAPGKISPPVNALTVASGGQQPAS
jgi:hypothetical protein